MHLFCFFVPRTQKMSDAHGSLDILDVFSAVLCNCAVNGGTPVKIFDSRNAKCNSGKGGKTVLLDFLRKTSARVKEGNKGVNRTVSKSKSSPRCQISKASRIHDGFNMGIFRSTAHWYCIQYSYGVPEREVRTQYFGPPCSSAIRCVT
jgi:hypothetical protein